MPPPTKFGPGGAAQAALAAPRPGIAPPPGRPGSTAAPARFTGPPPPRVIQRSEINWRGLDRQPHWGAFVDKFGDKLDLGSDLENTGILYRQFVSTLELERLKNFTDTFDEATDYGSVADLLVLFIKQNKGFRYNPTGAHCGGVQKHFKRMLDKLQVPNVETISIGGKGLRVIVVAPMMIDPNWRGSRVLDVNGKVIGGLAAFETHHAVKIGSTIYDPTGGYCGPESDWYAQMTASSTEEANKRTGFLERFGTPEDARRHVQDLRAALQQPRCADQHCRRGGL